MKLKCPATHVLWPFGTQNSIVTFIFKFDPRKGQLKVKLGQISKFRISFQNMPILGSFVSGFQKSLLFLYMATRNAKNCISKICHHYFYLLFWPLHSQKQRHCFEIWYARCLYAPRLHIFCFLDNCLILVFIGNYFLEIQILNFEGQNRKKNIKNSR